MSCHKCITCIVYIIVYNLAFSINRLFTLWGRFLYETQFIRIHNNDFRFHKTFWNRCHSCNNWLFHKCTLIFFEVALFILKKWWTFWRFVQIRNCYNFLENLTFFLTTEWMPHFILCDNTIAFKLSNIAFIFVSIFASILASMAIILLSTENENSSSNNLILHVIMLKAYTSLLRRKNEYIKTLTLSM